MKTGTGLLYANEAGYPFRIKSDLDKDTVILFNLAAPGENKNCCVQA